VRSHVCISTKFQQIQVTVRSTETFNISGFLLIIIDVLFRLLCVNEFPLNGRKFRSILYGTLDAILKSFVLETLGDIR
jgi:hypothetical protein